MPKQPSSELIPKRVVDRIAVYYRYLQNMVDQGIDRISSKELSNMIGITASQLRQDLHFFGSFGQQGFGYRTEELLYRIKKLIGLDLRQSMVLIGAGNLGSAIASYESFVNKGFDLIGIFDSNPEVIGTAINGLLVQDVRELESFLQRNTVNIGIITAPASPAQGIADILSAGGVNAIWNYAPVKLIVPKHVTVEHIHLTDSLVSLVFQANIKKRGGISENS